MTGGVSSNQYHLARMQTFVVASTVAASTLTGFYDRCSKNETLKTAASSSTETIGSGRFQCCGTEVSWLASVCERTSRENIIYFFLHSLIACRLEIPHRRLHVRVSQPLLHCANVHPSPQTSCRE